MKILRNTIEWLALIAAVCLLAAALITDRRELLAAGFACFASSEVLKRIGNRKKPEDA